MLLLLTLPNFEASLSNASLVDFDGKAEEDQIREEDEKELKLEQVELVD
jgi:hypothetical protein